MWRFLLHLVSVLWKISWAKIKVGEPRKALIQGFNSPGFHKNIFNFFFFFNVNTFLKSVSTLKSPVTHDLDTDTTTHIIIGVVGSCLYLAMPVSTALPKSHLSLLNLAFAVFDPIQYLRRIIEIKTGNNSLKRRAVRSIKVVVKVLL